MPLYTADNDRWFYCDPCFLQFDNMPIDITKPHSDPAQWKCSRMLECSECEEAILAPYVKESFEYQGDAPSFCSTCDKPVCPQIIDVPRYCDGCLVYCDWCNSLICEICEDLYHGTRCTGCQKRVCGGPNKEPICYSCSHPKKEEL